MFDSASVNSISSMPAMKGFFEFKAHAGIFPLTVRATIIDDRNFTSPFMKNPSRKATVRGNDPRLSV